MQSKKNARNTWVRSYIRNGVSGDWFKQNVTLVHGLVEGGGLRKGRKYMEPIGFPETSVSTYQSTLCNFPEERRSHLYRGGSGCVGALHSGYFEWLKNTKTRTQKQNKDTTVHCLRITQ